jgi:phospholipid transport system substrate-binding protein
MKKTCIKYLATVFLLINSLVVLAAQQDPMKFLKDVSDSVMSELRKNKSEIASEPNKLYDLIQRFIIPNVDFIEMSQWIAGRKAWAQASSSQQDEFIQQFKILVVKTYGSALIGYSDNKVTFPPQDIDVTKDRIEVVSWVKRPSNDDIRVKYRLVKNGDSWKVYDLEVEGVSILRGFMAQFSEEIRNQGLSSAIQQMKEHNGKK